MLDESPSSEGLSFWCARQAARIRLFDAELLDPIAKRPKAHAEELCGRGLVVAGLFQRLHDGVALDVLELRAECARPLDGSCAAAGVAGSEASGTGRTAERTLMLSAGDHAARTERHRALEHVLQLAHVAGERVVAAASAIALSSSLGASTRMRRLSRVRIGAGEVRNVFTALTQATARASR